MANNALRMLPFADNPFFYTTKITSFNPLFSLSKSLSFRQYGITMQYKWRFHLSSTIAPPILPGLPPKDTR
jgi:hypothetical protein